METIFQDLRYALRQFRKSPGFTVVALITLAMGIGVNTVMFSVVNGVLLSPLPFPNADRLVTLHENKPNFEGGSLSYPNFRDWQKDNHSFSSMAIARSYAFGLSGSGEAEQLNGEFVSSEFFPILGVNPVLGRNFGTGEDEVGAGPVALISEGLWRRKFSAAAGVLGKSITLDSKDYTVVGVIPSNFHLSVPGFREGDIYVPIGQWSNPLLQTRGAGLGIHGLGRLKSGVTVEQAIADLAGVTRNLATAFPETDKGITAKVVPLKSQMVSHVQSTLTLLLAAVGFVLLIACANVGNLFLARSSGRTREFALRATLGARRGRLVRQLLTESILLSLAGGALGLLLAAWGTNASLAMLPSALPRAEAVGLDLRVLIFTAIISLVTGVLFGLTPALRSSAPNLSDRLKEGGRGMSGSRHQVQGAFVVAEIGLAVVLLAGAGLMVRSLMTVWNVDPGFNPHNVLTFGVSLPPSMVKAKPDAIRAAFRDFDAHVASIPGVQGISQVWGALPFGPDDEQLFLLEGQPKPTNENDMNWAIDYIVEPGYLKAMGIPLQRGRFFTPQDNEKTPLVVAVDEIFANTYFPHQDPIGKRIQINRFSQLAEIVGVVGHVKQWGLDGDEKQSLRSELYIPCMQMPNDFVAMAPSGSTVVIRGAGATAGLFDAIRRISSQMSNEQAIFAPQTMDSAISQSLASRQFSMILLVLFASMALLLASIGIYGVISYIVAQRTPEIGLRIALGARPLDILCLIFGRGGRLTAVGLVVGIAAALVLTRLMTSLLYGVSSADPVTFVGVALSLTLVALVACYIPARRATKVEPSAALRCE